MVATYDKGALDPLEVRECEEYVAGQRADYCREIVYVDATHPHYRELIVGLGISEVEDVYHLLVPETIVAAVRELVSPGAKAYIAGAMNQCIDAFVARLVYDSQSTTIFRGSNPCPIPPFGETKYFENEATVPIDAVLAGDPQLRLYIRKPWWNVTYIAAVQFFNLRVYGFYTPSPVATLPRFGIEDLVYPACMVPGQEFVVGVVVRNVGGSGGEAVVRLETSVGYVEDEEAVYVEKGGTAPVELRAIAPTREGLHTWFVKVINPATGLEDARQPITFTVSPACAEYAPTPPKKIPGWAVALGLGLGMGGLMLALRRRRRGGARG